MTGLVEAVMASDFTSLVRNFRDHIAVAGTNGITASTLFDEMHVSDRVGMYILKKLMKRKEGWVINGVIDDLTEEAIESMLCLDNLKNITIIAPDYVIWNILGIDSVTVREKLPDIALVLLSIVAGTKERGCLITDASKLMNSPKIHSVVEKLALYGIIFKRMLIPNNLKGIGSRVACRTNILHLKRYAAEYDPSVDNCFFESDDDVKQSIIDYIVLIMKTRKVSSISTSALNKVMGISRRKMHLIRSTMATVKMPRIHFFEGEIAQNKFRKVWFVGLNDTCDNIQPPFGSAVIKHMSAIEQIVVRLNESKDGLSTRDFRNYLGMGKKRAVNTYQEILQTFKYPVKKVNEGRVISFKLLPKNLSVDVDNPNRNLTQLQQERLNSAVDILTKCNGIMLIDTFYAKIKTCEVVSSRKQKSTFDRKSLTRLIDYMVNHDMVIRAEHNSVDVIALKEGEDLNTRIQYFVEHLNDEEEIEELEVDRKDYNDADNDFADNENPYNKLKSKKNPSRKPRSSKPNTSMDDKYHSPSRKRSKIVDVSSSSSIDSDSDYDGSIGDGGRGKGDDDNNNDDDDNNNNDDDHDDDNDNDAEEETQHKRKRVSRKRNYTPNVRRDTKVDQTENLSDFDNALILERVILDTIDRKLVNGEFKNNNMYMQFPECSFKDNASLLSCFLSLEPAILLVPQRVSVSTYKRQLTVSRNYVVSLMKRDILFTISGIVTFIVSNLGHDISPEFVDLLNAVFSREAQSFAITKRPSYYATRTRILQFYCSDESNVAELTDKFDIQLVCEVIGELLRYNWIGELDFTKKHYSLENFTINREFLSTTFSGLFGIIYGKIISDKTKIDGESTSIASYLTIPENFEKKNKKLTGTDTMTLIYSTVSGLGVTGGDLRVNVNDSSDTIHFKTSTLLPSGLDQLVENKEDIDTCPGADDLIDDSSIQVSHPNLGHYQKSLNRITSSFQLQKNDVIPTSNTNTSTKWKKPTVSNPPISIEVRQKLLQVLLNFKDDALTAEEIQKKMVNVSLHEVQLALNFWIANNVVIEIPCMIIIGYPPSFVHTNYAHLFVVCDNDEGFCPWMNLKGERNMAMFTLFRSKVLSTLTSYPGSNIHKINGTLPMLLLFQTKVLLKILEEDGLIYTENETSTSLAGPFEAKRTISPTGKYIYFIKVY